VTDPPYHDDAQYSELSLPFRVWARIATNSLPGEAVVNSATGHNSGLGAYSALLTRIFAESRRVLRPEGHLVFGYANRLPEAWIDLFHALQDAGFWAVGYTIVHSENETDQAKRGVRACALDLLMDLLPTREPSLEQWRPSSHPTSPEEEFLALVGDTFLQVGQLLPGWEVNFSKRLRMSRFLAS